MKYYSVTVWEPDAYGVEPMTSVFLTRKQAEDFKTAMESLLTKKNLDNLIVTIDSGKINERSYLEWFNTQDEGLQNDETK